MMKMKFYNFNQNNNPSYGKNEGLIKPKLEENKPKNDDLQYYLI